MNSVLVTGGAGFVGSHVALALRGAGAQVVAMDNLHREGSALNVPRLEAAGVKFHRGDIRRQDEFPSGPFDLVVECSAEPSVLAGYDGRPDYLIETNLLGTYRCLEFCRRWGSGMIFLSTSRVYPLERLRRQPVHEEATRFVWLDAETRDCDGAISSRGVREEAVEGGARSLYGFTKRASEMLVEEYRDAFGVRACINRCGVLAGPWQMGRVDQGVVALWVRAHREGISLSYIGYGGKGKQLRDVLHVSDLAELVLEQARDLGAWDGWCGNVAGGLEQSVSLMELTEICREVTGRETLIQSVSETRPGDIPVFYADCRRLWERTSWRPRRGVRQVVEDLFQWLEDLECELPPLS